MKVYRIISGALALTISKLDGSRVLVVLGGKDMDDFSLDYNLMSMEDIHSRKVILRLTRLACRKSGIDTAGKRVSIEALTVGEGCYLLVTVKKRQRRYKLKRGGCLCWRFGDCSAFLGAVEALARQPYRMSRNAAYFFRGEYFLIFDYPTLPAPLRRALGEFASASGKSLMCAEVREQGKPVCEKNAVAVIGKALA